MVQVAVCLVLIFGAGLFARTLHNLRSIETGLDLRNIVLLSIDTRLAGYPPDRSAEFQGRWLRRVRMVPGVTSAALASIVAMSGASEGSDLVVPGSSRGKGGLVNNFFNAVTPDYFRTVGIPLVAGRLFTDTDDANAGRVVIVNQQFVDYYWPGESALGRVIAPRGQQATIIGIVETAKYRGLREDPAIVIYRPLAQHPAARVTLHAKVSGNTAATAQAIARAGREIEPAIPTLEIDTFFSVVDAQIANERVLNVLASLFAALALVITGVGLYGLVAYSVTRRTREIVVRMAIGARLGHLVRLFVARVAALVVAGALVGVPLALAAGRQIHSLLYGLEPTSVSTLVPATLMLIIVAVTAAGIPAFRAARVNPVIALRDS
jgi:predicted permease